MGLRRKESVQFRPFESVVSFAESGLSPQQGEADRYVRVKGKGGRVRVIPLDRPARLAALALAQDVIGSRDAHLGDPSRDLKRNLRRFDYVMEKFGITVRARDHGPRAAPRGVDGHLSGRNRRGAASAGRWSIGPGDRPGGTAGGLPSCWTCPNQGGWGVFRPVGCYGQYGAQCPATS